jgi:hypothetical protein
MTTWNCRIVRRQGGNSFALFSSAAHVEEWRRGRADTDSCGLTSGGVPAIGQAIFRPVFAGI